MFYKSINSAFSSGLHYDKDAELAYFENKSFLFRQFNGDYYAILCQQLNRKAFDIRNGIKLKAGFRNITYDEINGKDEFNQKRNFAALHTDHK